MTSSNNQTIESEGETAQYNFLNKQDQKMNKETKINDNSNSDTLINAYVTFCKFIVNIFTITFLNGIFLLIIITFFFGITEQAFIEGFFGFIGLVGLVALIWYSKNKNTRLLMVILKIIELIIYVACFIFLIYTMDYGYVNLGEEFLESAYYILFGFLGVFIEFGIIYGKYYEFFTKTNILTDNDQSIQETPQFPPRNINSFFHIGWFLYFNLILSIALFCETDLWFLDGVKIYCWVFLGLEIIIILIFLYTRDINKAIKFDDIHGNASNAANQSFNKVNLSLYEKRGSLFSEFWSKMQLNNKQFTKIYNNTLLVIINIFIGIISLASLDPHHSFLRTEFIDSPYNYYGIDIRDSSFHLGFTLLFCELIIIFLHYFRRNCYLFIINKFENLLIIGGNFAFMFLIGLGILNPETTLIIIGYSGIILEILLFFMLYIIHVQSLKQTRLLVEINAYIFGDRSEDNNYTLSLKAIIRQNRVFKYINRNIGDWILKQCIKICERAKTQEKHHSFRAARRNWKSAFLKLGLAIKKNPTLTKKAMISDLILLIQKHMGMTYFSESIYLSSEAWIAYEQKDYKRAFKNYKLAQNALENAIKYIAKKERKTIKFVFPIKITTLHNILQLFQGIIKQIEIELRQKNQTNILKYVSELNEIFAITHKSLEEINQTLWMYCDSFITEKIKLEQSHIEEIFETKLGLSVYNLSNLQERINSLTDYFQTPEFKEKSLTDSLPVIQFDVKKKDLETRDLKKDTLKTNDLKNEKISNFTAKENENRDVQNQIIIQKSTNTIRILREYEYIGGKIRFKVGLVNKSGIVITNLALRFDLPDALKWIILEPNYEKRGDTILIPKLGGNEKIALSLYLEPVNCLESAINATLTYFDSNDHPQALIMPPKKVSITCPIFFTREEANLARVKSLKHHLTYNDQKIFPLAKQDNVEIVFNHILDTIGKHDIKLVHQDFSSAKQTGEAWYYGITKVKLQKMIIHINLDSSHHILAVKVNGDNPESITGLLAELEGQIREKLIHSKIINNGTIFNDISTSVLLGHCPYCNGPISAEWTGLYKKGEIISCKYCDSSILPY